MFVLAGRTKGRKHKMRTSKSQTKECRTVAAFSEESFSETPPYFCVFFSRDVRREKLFCRWKKILAIKKGRIPSHLFSLWEWLVSIIPSMRGESAASTAQKNHRAVVGGCRKRRKPRQSHSPPENFLSENERHEDYDHGREIFFITREVFSRAHEFSLCLRILCCSVRFFSARSIFVSDGQSLQCILCRLTAKMCWREFPCDKKH